MDLIYLNRWQNDVSVATRHVLIRKIKQTTALTIITSSIVYDRRPKTIEIFNVEL